MSKARHGDRGHSCSDRNCEGIIPYRHAACGKLKRRREKERKITALHT